MESNWFLFLLIVFATISSCSQDSYVYDHRFEGACWGMDDTLSMELAGQKPLAVKLVLDEDYPLQNIFLKMMIKGDAGTANSFILADTVLSPTGEWLVEKTTAGYTAIIPLPAGKLPAEEEVSVHLIQFMREEKLCGIQRVGIVGFNN